MENISTNGNNKTEVVVFGFGGQGMAQALNLRDNGWKVSVYLRPTSTRISQVKEAGLPLITDPVVAAKNAKKAVVLLPDSQQPAFYKEYLEGNLPKGSTLIFAHGLAIHYKQITPRNDLDIVLVAPLAHANAVRGEFLKGTGVPCMIAAAQNSSGEALEFAHTYAKAISKTGPFLDTTFAEEVETDLFAEQALLCGGLPELVKATFDTLTEAGYNPEAAYFSCLKELRPIVELLDQHAISGLRDKISDTARYGAVTRGPRVIGGHAKKELGNILAEIRSGVFMTEFINEGRSGYQTSKTQAKDDSRHQLEKIHRRYNPNAG